MPRPQRSIYATSKLWLISGVGLALWAAGCSDTTEPINRPEPLAPHPVAAADSMLGKSVLPTMDTYINSDVANRNYGGHDTLLIQKNPGKAVTRNLFAFPRAGIADSISGDSLVSATLELTIKHAGTDWGTSGRAVALHRMTRDWLERGATWSCANDLNVGNLKTDCPGDTWTPAGSAPPFVTTPVAQSIITNDQTGAVQFDVTSDVRAFLANQAPNQGWMLKLASETLTGTVVFHARESASKPRLVLTILPRQAVPAAAPDSVPAWFSHDTSWATNGFQYLKHIVAVVFKPGTSQADRTSAVSLIGGRVVGGWSLAPSEGAYAVEVLDSGDPERVFQAITQLQGLTQVRGAAVNPLISSTYLRPEDGANWKKIQWQLRPDNVQSVGPRWALEAIGAPMAWGCSIGSPNAPVVVIDHNFDATEIAPNLIGPLPPLGANPLDTIRHGTAVTNIIAAHGNDSTGMTGVMWEAGITAIHIAGSGVKVGGLDALRAVSSSMFASIGHGVVINISLGTRWDTLPGMGSLTKAQDSLQFMNSWALVGGSLKGVNSDALLIISAGNQNDRGQQQDAWWSGWPQLRDSLPGQVLVVGSSNAARQRASFSSVGPTVEIYAPGESVYTHGPSPSTLSNPGPGNGDSFATAYVTGVAGLLMSFNPTLTGPQVRSFILDGADSGQRVVTPTNKKLLDAYQALKAAARHSGSPLCGNRIWANAGQVYASRSPGPEALFSPAGGERGVFALAAHHGGRQIDMIGWSGPNRSFSLHGTQWSENSEPTDVFSNQSGVANSLWGLSHDGNEEVFLDLTAFGSRILRVEHYDSTGISLIAPDTVLQMLQTYPETTCAWRTTSCGGVGRGTNDEYALPWAVAYSPMGDHAVVAYSVRRTTATFNGDWKPCPWSVPDPETGNPSDECLDSISYEKNGVKAYLLDYPLPHGPPRLITTLDNTVVNSVAISEDGTQLIVNEGMKHENWDALPAGPEGCSPVQPGVFGFCIVANYTESNTSCMVTYRSFATGDVIESIPARYACELPVGAMSASVTRRGGRQHLKVPLTH